MAATNDPDQGANIGGGIAVLFSIPTGIVAGLLYIVVTSGARR